MTLLRDYGKWIAGLITAFALAFLLAGCTNAASTDASQSDKKQEEQVLNINAIDGDCYSFKATNETGKVVKTLTIMKSNEEEKVWSDNLLGENTWKKNEKAKLNFSKDASAQTSESPEGASVVVKPTYDIQIVFEDDTTYVIHSVPVETLDSASEGHLKIDAESNLAYFEFDNVDGFTSTLDNDKQVKEAEAKAAEEAKKAEEEAATAAAAAEAAAAQSYNNSYSNTSGGTTRNSGGSSQSQNDCTGGFVTK